MAQNKTAAAFLQALDRGAENPESDMLVPRPVGRPSKSREGLKHIGGYFDRGMAEKVAILRARLGLDNSQLLVRAINELFQRESARSAFGD